MRAATRKRTEAHKDQMAVRAAKRDLRRRRRIGLLVGQAQAREMARRLVEARDEKFCEPVDCQPDDSASIASS